MGKSMTQKTYWGKVKRSHGVFAMLTRPNCPRGLVCTGEEHAVSCIAKLGAPPRGHLGVSVGLVEDPETWKIHAAYSEQKLGVLFLGIMLVSSVLSNNIVADHRQHYTLEYRLVKGTNYKQVYQLKLPRKRLSGAP